MTVTNDPTNNIGKVRTLTQDPTGAFHSDEEITNVFLGLNDSSDTSVLVRLAAADALDSIAADQVLLLKKIEIVGSLDLDGPAVAKSLREQAMVLRSAALGIYDPAEQFDIIETNWTPTVYRDLILNDWLETIA